MFTCLISLPPTSTLPVLWVLWLAAFTSGSRGRFGPAGALNWETGPTVGSLAGRRPEGLKGSWMVGRGISLAVWEVG